MDRKDFNLSGLSGNEMYCLHQKGLSPGHMVIGNSVYSMGFVGGLTSGLKTLAGGEISEITSLIHDARKQSYERMMADARRHGGLGITGVSNDLIFHGGNVEYLSIGSCVHREKPGTETLSFTSSADGQELYSLLDGGFTPHKFVFGNVAYSIGLGGGLLGAFRGLARGEVKEYSDIFKRTRHLALERIVADAKSSGSTAVMGIETSVMPLMGVQEMVMTGTSCTHPLLVNFGEQPVTSDLTCEEMWNAVHMGYMPVRLVMGVSVYSLGVVGGIATAFKSLVRGELTQVTSMIYEARENVLDQMHREAKAFGADTVLGVRSYVYDLGSGILEFVAIGTAVRKVEGLTTVSPTLPAQAVIVDRDTYVAPGLGNLMPSSLGRSSRAPTAALPGLVGLVMFLFFLFVSAVAFFFNHRS